jgi:aminoglycoside phosphotransferase (APT) family kinase protein
VTTDPAIPEATLDWVRSVIGHGSTIVAIEPMPEASHTNHRVTVATGKVVRAELVVRRYTNEELRAGDPWYVPADEVAVLEALERLNLPVPRLLAADVDAIACDVPTLLVAWLPGRPEDRPADRDAFVRAVAEPLHVFHRSPTGDVTRRYEPYLVSDGISFDTLRPPRWAKDRAVWERAFAAAAAEPPSHRAAFIHRDYHHGNMLWRDGVLTGIVDWTTGCIGPASIDLAHMRVNHAWGFDLETADAFLDAWRVGSDDPDAYHPFWDLIDAIDSVGDDMSKELPSPAGLDRHETFIRRALAELGA